MRTQKYRMLVIICLSFIMMVTLGNRESLAADVAEKGSYGDEITWTLDSEGVMRISGSGSSLWSWDYYEWEEAGITLEERDAIRKAVLSADTIIIGEGITNIGNSEEGGVFSDCPKLKKIVLPASLTRIDGLKGNSSLTEVVIPDDSSADWVGMDAFRGCKSLTSLELPGGITRISEGAFNGTGIESIVIPAGVTESYEMLWGSSITEVTYLPKKVDKNTFAGSSAETIIFGNNLSSISNNAFTECENLKNVVFMNDYDYNSKLFSNLSDVAIFRKHATGKLTLEEASSGTKNVTVPSELAEFYVTRIGDYAFDSNKYVRTVKLPSSIEKIGAYAFYNCSKLNKITLNEGITSIGKFAFYGCNSLSSIKLPTTLTSIGERAFWNCYSFTTLTIPPSVTTIGANAFESCTSLTTITIGEKGTTKVSELVMPTVYAASAKKSSYITIKKNAFSNCKSLKKLIIGAKVKSIGSKAFYKCSNLKTIIIKSKKLKSSTIGSNAFKGIKKTATIKVPKTKMKAYKKILLKKGATKKMNYKGI